MEILIVLAVVTVVVSLPVGWLLARWWTWRGVVRRRVLVQTDADVTFDGVLVARKGPLLMLADVTVRTSSQARADGLVVIERSRVLWIQVAA